MEAKKSINPGAVHPEHHWLVVCCNVEGNRVVESHHRESGAMHAAIIFNEHDHKYGHRNQYIVRHHTEVTIID